MATKYISFGNYVSVHVTTKDILDAEAGVKVSWSSIGAVSVAEAAQFAEDLWRANKFAQEQLAKLTNQN